MPRRKNTVNVGNVPRDLWEKINIVRLKMTKGGVANKGDFVAWIFESFLKDNEEGRFDDLF